MKPTRRGERDDALHETGGRLGPFSRGTYHLLRLLARALSFGYFRVWVHNGEAMPRDGAVIVSPMHRSNLDVPLLGATSPRRLRYLAKGSLFKNRFWTWLLTVVGGFPLARESQADRAALKAALRVLERGEALAVFPEGERKSGPTVYPMLDGAVWLAAKAGVPILPVGIGGSERAMPKGANLPKPTKIVYLYGDLIPPLQPANGKRATRAELKELSDRLRATLQELFDEAQVRAGCPNPPLDQRPPLPEESSG